MENSRSCFPFIQVPVRPEKPRVSGLTIVSDRGLAPMEVTNLLASHGEVIDYAKFTEHHANLGRRPKEYFQTKIDLYHQNGVKVFPGGVTFEVAALQGQVQPFMETLKDLGFDGVEISEDVIPPMAPEVRLSYIRLAKELGLQAFTEVGRKDPTEPMDAEEAIDAIRRDLDAGAKKTTIENSDIVLLMNTNPKPLERIIEAVGLETLVFEVGPNGWPQVATWVVRTVGGETNLENMNPDQVTIVDAMRRGMHRNVNYEFLSRRGGRV